MKACQTCSSTPSVLFGYIAEADDECRLTFQNLVTVDLNQLVDYLPVIHRHEALAERFPGTFLDGVSRCADLLYPNLRHHSQIRGDHGRIAALSCSLAGCQYDGNTEFIIPGLQSTSVELNGCYSVSFRHRSTSSKACSGE